MHKHRKQTGEGCREMGKIGKGLKIRMFNIFIWVIFA